MTWIGIIGPNEAEGRLMVSKLLDPATHDIDISSGGFDLVSGDEEVRQKLNIRMRFLQGEWFLDQRIGIPYFQEILVKNPDEGRIRDIYRQTILTTPGVRDLQDLTVTVDADRVLRVTFTAFLDSGGVLDFDEEFIIV